MPDRRAEAQVLAAVREQPATADMLADSEATEAAFRRLLEAGDLSYHLGGLYGLPKTYEGDVTLNPQWRRLLEGDMPYTPPGINPLLTAGLAYRASWEKGKPVRLTSRGRVRALRSTGTEGPQRAPTEEERPVTRMNENPRVWSVTTKAQGEAFLESLMPAWRAALPNRLQAERFDEALAELRPEVMALIERHLVQEWAQHSKSLRELAESMPTLALRSYFLRAQTPEISFEIESGKGRRYTVSNKVVVRLIAATNGEERRQIEHALSRVENANPLLRHLAEGLSEEYDRQNVKLDISTAEGRAELDLRVIAKLSEQPGAIFGEIYSFTNKLLRPADNVHEISKLREVKDPIEFVSERFPTEQHLYQAIDEYVQGERSGRKDIGSAFESPSEFVYRLERFIVGERVRPDGSALSVSEDVLRPVGAYSAGDSAYVLRADGGRRNVKIIVETAGWFGPSARVEDLDGEGPPLQDDDLLVYNHLEGEAIDDARQALSVLSKSLSTAPPALADAQDTLIDAFDHIHTELCEGAAKDIAIFHLGIALDYFYYARSRVNEGERDIRDLRRNARYLALQALSIAESCSSGQIDLGLPPVRSTVLPAEGLDAADRFFDGGDDIE